MVRHCSMIRQLFTFFTSWGRDLFKRWIIIYFHLKYDLILLLFKTCNSTEMWTIIYINYWFGIGAISLLYKVSIFVLHSEVIILFYFLGLNLKYSIISIGCWKLSCIFLQLIRSFCVIKSHRISLFCVIIEFASVAFVCTSSDCRFHWFKWISCGVRNI